MSRYYQMLEMQEKNFNVRFMRFLHIIFFSLPVFTYVSVKKMKRN